MEIEPQTLLHRCKRYTIQSHSCKLVIESNNIYLDFIYFNGNVGIKPSKHLQRRFEIFCHSHFCLYSTKLFCFIDYDHIATMNKKTHYFISWSLPATGGILEWKIGQVSILDMAIFLKKYQNLVNLPYKIYKLDRMPFNSLNFFSFSERQRVNSVTEDREVQPKTNWK